MVVSDIQVVSVEMKRRRRKGLTRMQLLQTKVNAFPLIPVSWSTCLFVLTVRYVIAIGGVRSPVEERQNCLDRSCRSSHANMERSTGHARID